MIKQEQVQKKISGLESLPSFRLLAGALRSMLRNDEPRDYREYLTTLSKDPALTARIISIANSAFYYSIEPIYSIKDAADRLGIVKLKSIVAGHILSSTLKITDCPLFDKSLYWKKAMLVAVCASHIADNIENSPLKSNAYYSLGLLHNIGILVLVITCPDTMNTIFSQTDKNHTISDLEKNHFDQLTHHTIGAQLIRQWKLPDVFFVSMEKHIDKEYKGEFQKSVQLLRQAKHFVENGFQIQEENALKIDNTQLSAILSGYEKDKKWIEEFTQYL